MEGWLTVFGWLLSVLTAIGNGFVIGFVAKNRRLHHSSANWFVVSLAIADLAVGIVVFPSSYVCNNMLSCNRRVHMGAFWFFVHSSVTNLCILTWDRYTAIVHPFKYTMSIPARRPRRIILTAWLIPLMISLALVLGMYATSSFTVWKVVRLTGVSLFDILTCALLVYALVRIMVVARAQSLQDSAMESLKRYIVSLQQRAQEKQPSIENVPPRRVKTYNTARFMIVIVVSFLGCHVTINYLVLRIMFGSDVSSDIGLVVTVLLVGNSAVNPFVYAFLKRDIKTEIVQFISSRKNKSGSSCMRHSRSSQMVQS